MKLRTQILAFGLAGAALAGLVGGIGLFASTRLGGSINDAVLAGAALQSSQKADMMHDAIHGDAQLAYLGTLEDDKARIAEAEKGLKEHAETFNAALDKLQNLPLSAEARQAEDAARPIVKKYIETAERVIKASASDRDSARAALPALQASFADLEEKMAALSDAIGKNGDALNAQAQASVRQVQWAIAAALLLATAAMVAAALWMAGRMARPMAHAVDVADRLAQGDLTAHVAAAGNDETVRLLEAMARMQANFSGIVRGVQGNADQVATASAQIAQGNNDLSQRTEQQASALEETAASMEELGSTVRQNADNAKQANQLARSASSVAIEGGDVVAQVVETM
jgi:methyl-accepting chemotaxis protein